MKELIRNILREEFILIEGKKLSTNDFIERAKQIHGDKYNYDKTNYVNSVTKVIITCPKHGDFLQNPMVHIHDKSGCPTCNGRPEINTEIFIKKAKEKHGNKYDYSQVNYKNQKTPLIITCPRHGTFTQRPNDHLKGTGCQKCGIELNIKNRTSNTDEFIEKSKKIHGDKYNYEEVVYKNAMTSVKIICPIHGVFNQKPNYHLSGHGCDECGMEKFKHSRKSNTEDFIKMANNKFNNKYDYSNVTYTDSETKVPIVCPKHGVFYKSPHHHLRGQGCPKCGYLTTSKKLSDTQEDFLEKARKQHGNKYDYSLVKYDKSNKPITIICPEHGKFNQIANQHLMGSGCPECGKLIAASIHRYDIDDFIQRAKEKHGEKYDYSLVDYQVSTKPVNIICSKHGVFSQTPQSHMNGTGCPLCQESKGERLIDIILNNLQIKFIRQYKFNDCKGATGKVRCRKLPFDFYLPEYNAVIEYDGRQHFTPIKKFGGEEGFKNIQISDNIKNNYCINNNIKLIRIPYTVNNKDIEYIIKKELGIK